VLHIINQLKFARMEFRKGFSGVNEADGAKRLLPVNSIAWMVGHMAWHEQYYWLQRAQGKVLFPLLNQSASFGKPPGELNLNEMVDCWERVIENADAYLLTLKKEDLLACMRVGEEELPFNIGTMVLRVTYHYWYHNGEMQAVRQLLGHQNLTDFVTDDIETIGKYDQDV